MKSIVEYFFKLWPLCDGNVNFKNIVLKIWENYELIVLIHGKETQGKYLYFI